MVLELCDRSAMNPYPFTAEDQFAPVYCTNCRKHIPKAMSNFQAGLCDFCFVPPHPPTPTYHGGPPPPPQQIHPGALGPAQQTRGVVLALCLGGGLFLIVFSRWVFRPREINKPAHAESHSAPAARVTPYLAPPPREIVDPIRGRKPVPSSWDGITPEANEYLRSSLNDYDSMKVVSCTVVFPYDSDAWSQIVTYRAKNGFGAFVLTKTLFVIRDGRVINAVSSGD